MISEEQERPEQLPVYIPEIEAPKEKITIQKMIEKAKNRKGLLAIEDSEYDYLKDECLNSGDVEKSVRFDEATAPRRNLVMKL